MKERLQGIPKLVVTDWDGTFAEQASSPRPEAIQAKDELLSLGSLVVLVSGRSIKETTDYVRDYGLSPEFIAELGTVVYHNGKEIINHGNLRKYEGSASYSEFARYLDEEGVNAHDAMFRIGAVDKVLNESQQKGMSLKIFTPKDGHPGESGTNLMERKVLF